VRAITLIFVFAVTLLNFSANGQSTGEAFYFFYPAYYEQGAQNYELNFCHKNNAKLLKALKSEGAKLEEILVLIIQQDKSKARLTPQNGRFDNKYAWHVVLLHDGVIYDLNAKYSEEGISVEDYFPYVLGYDTKLSNIMLRVVGAKRFYNYFYNSKGQLKKYNAQDFIDRFLSLESKFQLSPASMLKWY